jgi:CRP-like cAMP-binding protein
MLDRQFVPGGRNEMAIDQSIIQNKILRGLAAEDFALVAPKLKIQEYALRAELEVPHRRITHLAFFETAIASIVSKSPRGNDIEIGLAGYEGMSGTSLILGSDVSPLATYIQLAGIAYQVSASDLIAAMGQSGTLKERLLHYVNYFLYQTATTALANGQAQAEARLARWLLMVHDRTIGNDLYLTHEFMSVMLGMRRPWVTTTLHTLEGKGLIRATRGKITIIDRTGLISDANGFYGISEPEYARLMGSALSK